MEILISIHSGPSTNNVMIKRKNTSLGKSLKTFAMVSAASIGIGSYANAGQVTWDFSSDPDGDGIVLSGNNDEIWVESGGNPGGFLAVTYPEGGQTGFVAFPSIDADNEIVTSFKLEGDVRIGNSIGERAADGFSVSLARDNGSDPVVEDLNSNGSISGQGNFAGGIAEGGSTTGVAVSFDTWSGNTLPDGGDIEGIIVRVDNVTVTRVSLPTRHGECEDITSLQTGPRNQQYWDDGGLPRDPESWAELCWQPFSVEVNDDAQLSVSFKGNKVLDNFQTDYFPTKSRLILAGRTGGANEHTHFDNLTLTTKAVSGGGAAPAPSNLEVGLQGAGFVDISWTAPATDDRVAYKVERDGVQLQGQVTGTSFRDFDVQPNSSYSYKVYTMSIAGDLSANAAGPVTAKTIGEVEIANFLKMNIYGDIGVPDSQILIFDDPNFPDNPSSSKYINGLDFTPGGIGDNYGGYVTGTLTPPESGDYHFFVRSDDASEFFLNESGAEVPDVTQEWPIAFEVDCCDGFYEPGLDDATTPVPIPLTAGKAYGFAMVVKEGGGGDWFQVAWRKEGDDTPADELEPITGAAIGGGMGDPTGAYITINAQPADISAPENANIPLSVDVDGGSPYFDTVLYQWYKDGAIIPGANKSSMTLRNAQKGDAGSYHCSITVLGLSKDSDAATVTVTDYVPPTPLVAGNTIGINFASEEANGTVSGAAGVLGTQFWNNVEGASGNAMYLSADAGGSVGNTEISVTWESPNTWASRGRGEENNSADGEDAALMTGYIDTNGEDPNTVTVQGLPDDVTYDVIVYTKGGVIGRGGDYTVAGSGGGSVDPGLSNGMVAYWNFNDQDFNDSVGVFHGEERGTDVINFTSGPNVGFGSALALDGVDQFVEITGGDNTALSFEGGSMAVSAWFRIGGFDKGWQALVAKGEGNRWRVHRRGGESGFAHAGGTGEGPAGDDVTFDEWHHMVALSDAEGLDYGTRLYIDGEIYTENESVPELGENNKNVFIGNNPDTGNRTWNGDIDDVAIWDRILTEDEIQALASGAIAPGASATIAHVDADGFDGAWVEGSEGNFIVFKGVSGSSFTLQGQPTTGSPARAPINAVEILIGGGFTEPIAGGGGGGGGGGSIAGVSLQDGQVVIEYSGTLKSADAVTGPYNAVGGASSPYSVAPTKAAEFYIAE